MDIQKIINERKERLNLISSKFLFREFANVMRSGEFMFTPLSRIDKNVLNDNDETDRLLKEKYEQTKNRTYTN